jgi:small subunit ribosomal protein S1
MATESVGEWIPGDVAPDDGYWQALLSGGEGVGSGTAGAPVEIRDELPPHEPETPGGSASGDRWEEARRLFEAGQFIELPVIGFNRGGLVVGWNGLRGFVPASHLVCLPPFLEEEERQEELERLVGTRLRLRIIELDQGQGRFVLSERADLLDEDRRRDVLNSISPGDVRRGRVTNLCSFGAFVDLGGLEGLVHVSELSWGRVEHPSDVLEAGQPVEIYVINVDRERGRVGLSLKRLLPDPWQSIEERYHVGQFVEGTVTHVVDFGAFARVEEGLEGLIHVSELADHDVSHPRDVVKVGDTVKAQVISVDGERHRLGLSLREAQEPFLTG